MLAVSRVTTCTPIFSREGVSFYFFLETGISYVPESEVMNILTHARSFPGHYPHSDFLAQAWVCSNFS